MYVNQVIFYQIQGIYCALILAVGVGGGGVRVEFGEIGKWPHFLVIVLGLNIQLRFYYKTLRISFQANVLPTNL